MTNEIDLKENAALAVDDDECWGTEGARDENILIPRLLLAQKTSKIVEKEDAKPGDILDNVTGEVLGSCREGAKKEIRIIPFMMQESWMVFTKVEGGQDKFKEIVPYGPDNAHWDSDSGGERRDQTLDFFVLLEDQVKDDVPFPYIISFRRTSFQTGRKLSSHFTKCRERGEPAARYILSLNGDKEEKNGNTYYVWGFRVVEKTPKETEALAKKWWRTLKQARMTLAPEDVESGKARSGQSDMPPAPGLDDIPQYAPGY